MTVSTLMCAVAPLILEDDVTVQPTFIGTKNPVEQRNELKRLGDTRFDLIFYSPFTYEFSLEIAAFHNWRKSVTSHTKIRQAVSTAMKEFDRNIEILTASLTMLLSTSTIRRTSGDTISR